MPTSASKLSVEFGAQISNMESPVISPTNTDVIEIKSPSPLQHDTEHNNSKNTNIVGSSSSDDIEIMGMASSSSSRDVYEPEPQPEDSCGNGPQAGQSITIPDENAEAGSGAAESRPKHKRKARNEQPSGEHEIIDLTGDEDTQPLERVTSKTSSIRRRASAGASSSRTQIDTGHEHNVTLGRSASGRPRKFQASAPGDITVIVEPSNRRPSGPMRNSSFVLPRWQPDAEATYCPICRTQFSFFVRKHHCRKCGRVICSTCSPHRITIPYSFIVQPDLGMISPAQRNRGSIYVPHNTDSIAGLGGGEKVRICNTCVEMPPSVPPGEQERRDSGFSGRNSHRHDRALNNEQAHARFQGASETDAFSTRTSQSPGMPRDETMTARDFIMRSRSSTVSAESQANSQVYPGRPSHNSSRSLAANAITPLGYNGPRSLAINAVTSPGYNARGRSFIDYGAYQGRVTANNGGLITGSNPQPHYRSLLDPSHPSNTAQPDLSRPLPAAPRIAEEDECPVCHRELPSRTLTDFERLREEHINDCILRQISVHSGTVRPGAYTSNSQPPPQNSVTSPVHSNSPPLPAPPVVVPAPTLNTPEERTAARERAHAAVVLGRSGSNGTTSPGGSHQRLTGMFPYTATEKDCVDDAECTICLEEFEVGVGMARLECLCRFHRKCIRDWFKGHPGECPVHRMMGLD